MSQALHRPFSVVQVLLRLVKFHPYLVLLSSCSASSIAGLLFYLVQWAKKDQGAGCGTQSHSSSRASLNLTRILRIYIESASARLGLFGFYSFVLVGKTLLKFQIAQIQLRLAKDVSAFDGKLDSVLSQLLRYGCWSLPTAVASGLMSYLEKAISLDVRGVVQTSLHDLYFQPRSVSTLVTPGNKLQQGLDQRMTQDVSMMCHDISHLYGHLLNSSLEAFLLFFRISKFIGVLPLTFYCFYFFFAHTVLALSQPLFARLSAYQQELEGQFRSHHARVLTFAQEISFLKGTEEERDTSQRIFSLLVRHSYQADLLQFLSSVADSCVLKYGATILAYVMLLPMLVRGYENRAKKPLAGSIAQYLITARLLDDFGDALKDVVKQRSVWARLEGLVGRVSEVFVNLDPEWSAKKPSLFSTFLSRRKKSNVISSVLPSSSLCSCSSASCSSRSSSCYQHEEAKTFAQERTDGQMKVSISHLTISVPGKVLCKDLSLEIRQGDHLLVTGPNGCGKTSIFRVLAGLWPVSSTVTSSSASSCCLPSITTSSATSSASVTSLSCPTSSSFSCSSFVLLPPGVCFVPQKPYLSTSTLFAQVVYPIQAYDIPVDSDIVPFCTIPLSTNSCEDCEEGHAEEDTTKMLAPSSCSSSILQAYASSRADAVRVSDCLRLVGLQELQNKHGLHVPTDWLSVLSVGEQQRVAMARVYYHRPTFAVLDEATSAMSGEITETIYRICRDMNITMITIAHNESLSKFHRQRLRLAVTAEEGSWRIDGLPS